MKIFPAVAAVLAASVLAACGAEADTTPPPGPKPTVVLVHGAFEDASSWAQVTRKLQSENYPVVAPAVPLRGVAADTAALQGVLGAIKGPKILVGHSYGGLLISELASAPDVRALVYVAAFIPQAGETAGRLNSQFPGTLIGPATTHTVDSPDGPELYVNTDSFAALFAGGLPAADAAVSAAGQRPILAAAFDEKVATTAPGNVRKFAIVATRDQAIPPAAERFEAERAGAAITEVDSPHAVPAANPQAVVDVIHQAS
ncbi:alpha/beta hydrolase [Amycolatopsis tucumanensis]|uniref:Alpha/beta hydrolase n=1 Tax=Amycolatopsis tucumanensis TaxID=401106 RepID=A0ABP7J9F0_9PSEU|nr:alpha/beta hydrolase [Amycolatopsis tucumanensis]MCF6421812.1 alpha/beta hydrolase [Amycolatopsis tucumanensis]